MRQPAVVSNISLEKQELQNPAKILICSYMFCFELTFGDTMNKVNRNNSTKCANNLY